MITLKNVLVATDFSEPSESALDYGRALARTFGATLHVVHVLDNAYAHAMMGDGFPGAAYVGLMRDLGEAAQAQLEKVVREDDRRELGAKSVLLTSASPAQSIADYAREALADIVVIGTHGRSGLSHLLMGSVAEKVVRIAPCPVLTVRRQEREFVMPDAIQAVAHS